MPMELPGQMAAASPSQAQGKGAPFRSGAALLSAARLARRLPARRQAKFFAISRSTLASRNAPKPSCCLRRPPAQRSLCAGWEHPRGSVPDVPTPLSLAGPVCNPQIFGAYAHIAVNWAVPQMHLLALVLPLLPGSAHSSTHG